MSDRCPPDSIQAWSFALPAPMQWGVYDLNGVPGASGLLSNLYPGGRCDTFVGIPQSVATQYPIAANPGQFYRNRISRVYPQALVISQSNCPLELGQGGVLTL